MVMPFKESANSFELRPYGAFQTSLISGVLLLFGGGLIILGFFDKSQEQVGFKYWFVLAAAFILGGVIYLIIRLWKYYSGRLNIVTFDIEGIRVHNRKTGLVKSLTWDKKPRLSVDEDNESGNPIAIILSTDIHEDTIQINLDDYSNFFLTGHKLVEKTKTAIANYKAKYRKSLKVND